MTTEADLTFVLQAEGHPDNVFTDNSRAQTLYKSEGFVPEGTMRDVYKTPQGYKSLVVMSILRPEYVQATLQTQAV